MMAKQNNEVMDSQILAEHVGFLDNCFDASFSLQNSLSVVKEYVSEEQNEFISNKINKSTFCEKNNMSFQGKTMLDSSNCINIGTPQNAKIMSKKLQDWGLPPEITKKYEERGILEMFDWQVSCLGNSKVLLDGCNLVYSAPTSAGKTLVAEILTIKTILERRKKVIIILPFVSIVREKMFYLQDILSSCGIRVEGFMGSQAPAGGFQAVHLAICTIEKANSLVNKLLDEGSISELGAVIVDELHLLGDPHRGYILELLLTKIKYISSKSEDTHIQIVGMSATLPNLEMLANWLNAELFVTHFRPIPLDEYCLVGNKYYDKQKKCTKVVTQPLVDNDNVLNICLDTIKEGCSILIFCTTKNRCENLAQCISSSINKLGCSSGEMAGILRKELSVECITEVLEQLKNCPVGLDDFLKRTISFGVAYHHAGLTFDERDIIEGGFKSGAIRVLVATSTLSSGVNLPARKVIIRSPVFQKQTINILSYKQMVGRAGRMGRDTKGESILICTEVEKQIGFDLMTGDLEPVKSCIENEDKFMRAVLEMIASQVVCTKEELDLYVKCTLLSNQEAEAQSQNFLLENTLHELQNFELVRIQDCQNENHYIATPLGKACLSSSMAPNDGLSLFCELQKARQCLVLETDLHLIYLVTPYSVSSQWSNIDWLHLLTLWESLTKAMKRVGNLVGVQESFIIRNVRGGSKVKSDQNKLNIHKRFYTALALQDLVNEVPLSEVATKFQCARGFLQSLQQAAATFAGMVTAFCRQLGWKNLEMLISQFQDRLHFGIHCELLELMGLPSLNGKRARTLFDAGYVSIASIALADINMIENVLLKGVPFESEKELEGDDENDIKKRNKIKNIWVSGHCGMTAKEAALNLIIEARKYLEKEIGVSEIKWKNEAQYSSSIPEGLNKSIKNTAQKNDLMLSVAEEKDSIIKELNKTNNPPSNTLQVIPSQNSNVNNVSDTRKENGCEKPKHVINGFNHSSPRHRPVSLTDDKIIPDSNSNEIIEIKCTSKPQNIVDGGIVDPPSDTKDEIVWDSLNFTETAIENITKLRTSDKMFSPNISFGEMDDKMDLPKTEIHEYDNVTPAKSTSVKDVSLFSSEGDNSSIFNDSLPIDLIPSRLLDNKVNSILKQEISSDLEVKNSESILKVFKSTLIPVEDEQDIKLVYEDDDENIEATTLLNISDDIEIIETQHVNETIKESHIKSPFKRTPLRSKDSSQPLAKKKKTGTQSVTSLKPSVPQIVINFAKSKKFTIEISSYKLKCYLLRNNDIYDNIHVIENLKTTSVYLNIKNAILPTNEIIGSSILNIKSPTKDSNSCAIKGMTFCLEPMTCVYFDLSSFEENMSLLKKRLCAWFRKQNVVLKTLSLKTLYFHIKRWLGVDLHTTCTDISRAEWLIDSDEKIPNIAYLLKKYCKIDLSAISVKIENRQRKIRSLDVFEDMCIKSWAVGMIAEQQEQFLRNHSQSTIDIEIQVSKILANCEHYGITVDKDLASRLLIDVRNSQEVLQKKAFKLCGYHFNFNSSKDVAKVLGINNGIRKVSTKKSVLSSHHSPMASIVIYWRKLNSILTKILYPLTEKACIYTEGDRINPCYTMHTCTGRISMHEPNLQNVPRTFSIPVHYLSLNKVTSEDVMEFNCRNIFKAAPGHVMVSADYCQLEMRVLTHFSEDPVLTTIMKSDVDVFKSIASSWSNLPEEQVDDDLRQKAKQLCYGILYGMGNKTLAQYLDVSEMEAAAFMDSFYKTYPAVKKFTQYVIDECRDKGYVETLTKRRRYLPDINSSVVYKRGAAGRQAVNTTIQGSAADIAKSAMCAIETKTRNYEPKPRLILQMHDELIYEVVETNKKCFIAVLKQVMEETVKLRVPLPVKVKAGATWGTLQEVPMK